jgi:hypothetical protein
MSALARLTARLVWFGCLWLMRRRWIRWIQRESIHLVPIHRREAATQSFLRQNDFARRHGLRILTCSFLMMYGAILFGCAYWVVVQLYLAGYLVPRRP